MTEVTAASRDEAIRALSRWHWLMKDIAKGRCYKRAKFDMGVFLFHRSGSRPSFSSVWEFNTPDDWCGTVACAAGFGAIAGVFPTHRVALDDKGYIPHAPFAWDDVQHWLGLTLQQWSSIVYGHYRARARDALAAEVAQRIATVLKRRYHTAVRRVPLADRPWLGRQSAFPKPRGTRRSG